MSKKSRKRSRRKPFDKARQKKADYQHSKAIARRKAKLRYLKLQKQRAELIKSIRDRDAQREYEASTLTQKRKRTAAGTGSSRNEPFKGSAYWDKRNRQDEKRASAARSARSQTASPLKPKPKARKPKPVRLTPRRELGPKEIEAINRSRKKTRNSWSNDNCVEKPDSRKAGKIRQSGKGSGTYTPQKWC